MFFKSSILMSFKNRMFRLRFIKTQMIGSIPLRLSDESSLTYPDLGKMIQIPDPLMCIILCTIKDI